MDAAGAVSLLKTRESAGLQVVLFKLKRHPGLEPGSRFFFSVGQAAGPRLKAGVTKLNIDRTDSSGPVPPNGI